MIRQSQMRSPSILTSYESANNEMTSSSALKPAILCLHGFGTSALIFRMQTIRLVRELSSTFEFVFLDAPFESKPGPEVLPVFEDCGPYYSWTIPGTPEGKRIPKETIDMIQATMDDQLKSTGQPFVGVMGFSQGTRIAAGLLLQQQHDREQRGPSSEPDKKNTDFRFGVFLMGVPPILPPQYPTHEKLELINLPSVHVVGLEDAILEYGRDLCFNHFEQEKTKYIELDAVGHHLPDGANRLKTVKIARAILDVWAKA